MLSGFSKYIAVLLSNSNILEVKNSIICNASAHLTALIINYYMVVTVAALVFLTVL